MAITIIRDFTDGRFYPSANPINCTVDSNNNGKCNFRYICDVYVNGVKVYTNKLFPDPNTGYAFFQVSRILQDYIETFLPISPTKICEEAASNAAPTSHLSVYCKFGEEYDSSTDCDENIKQYVSLKTSNTFYVFETAISYEDFISFDYTDYYMSNAGTNQKFLTNSPREMDVTYNDSYFLDFMTLDSVVTNWTVLMTLRYYDGSVIPTSLTVPAQSSFDRYRLNIGPFDINRVQDDPVINQLVKSYDIELRYNGTIVSEKFTFNVKKPKEFRTRLAFVGLMGGIEHYTFYHRNRKTYNIDRKNYTKTLQSNKSSNWTYAVGERGDTTYKTSAKEMHMVATYCSADVSDWLYEMWMSPTVWTYRRPEALGFKVYQQDPSASPSLNKMIFYLPVNHGLEVGDEVYCMPDALYTDYQDKFTVVSVDGRNVDFGLTYNIYNATPTACGYLVAKKSWDTLPIVISDNTVEVKQKESKPVEYSLNYAMAYSKTTLRG